MFTFFVTAEGRFGIDDYLAGRGKSLRGHVHVATYDELSAVTSLPAGGVIFAAVDQLSAAGLAAAGMLGAQVVAQVPDAMVLNTPGRSLRRYDLLRHLFDSGCNRFNLVRAGDNPDHLRYPVFIRRERMHTGSCTPLLHTREELDRALGQLLLRRMPLSDLLIVEFCDTKSADGFYRKYSAMRIGDTIVARHLQADASWVVKSNSAVNEALVREELDYVTNDPHATWLKGVFDLARIEFGRVDYGIYRGEPQVWEINTSPTFARGEGSAGEVRRDEFGHLRNASREAINERMLAAFKRLERGNDSGPVSIVLPASLRASLANEERVRRRSTRFTKWAGAFAESRVGHAIWQTLRPALMRFAPVATRFARTGSQ